MVWLRRFSVCAVAFTLPLVVQPAAGAAPGDASVTVVHGLPDFTADIYVNGELLLDGFRPREVAGPLELAPGRYDIDIRNVGDPQDATPVLADTIDVPAGAVAAVVAHVDSAGEPTLSLFSNDLPDVRAGSGALVMRSVAEVSELEVLVDGRTVATHLASGDEERADLPAGIHRIEVRGEGGISLRGPLPLGEGGARIVYVIGSSEDDTLDLMVQTIDDISSAPSNVLSGTGGLADAPAGAIRWPVVISILLVVVACGLVTARVLR